MKNVNIILSTYRVTLPNYFEDGSPLSSNHIARSPSAARYQFYTEHEFDCGYKNIYRQIKSKSLGKVMPEHFFGNPEQFERMKSHRGISNASMGMRVDVDGKLGTIVGSNYSMNLDVMFSDGAIGNCHPHWQTTYYMNDTIVYEFKNKNHTTCNQTLQTK